MISLSSQGLSAVQNYESKELFTFVVGSTKYRVPKLIAIFISPIISKMLQDNPELNRFEINVKDETKTFRLLIQMAFGNQVQLDQNQSEMMQAFGKALGNDELVAICQSSSPKSNLDNINIDNAVILLNSKKKLHAKYDFIIEYIASHFSDISEQELEKLDIEDVQKILSHSKLRSRSESCIFRYVFGLYMEHNDDPRYSELFSKIKFEKLDEEEMSDFVNNFSSNQMTDGIWLALSRRLILPVAESGKQSMIADKMSDPTSRATSRHESPGNESKPVKKPTKVLEFNGTDYFHGCFASLRSKKKNISVSSSSVNTGTITSLINPSNKTNFWTGNQPDSWVKVELKKFRVRPTSYTIRGRYDHDFNQPQSWNFEGMHAGKWEILDTHVNEPLRVKEPRNFKLSTQNKYSSFRIKQTGPNTYGDQDLVLSAFEVFGEIFEN
ncbi:hypothetical protein TVAG_050090 [Trichomonas vaginalis G3]|uniref:BACK domain-containing protein n=1 Tax=Trichomonas vaginalis (strain ATCC PRA-98 / G3) TaxID=412133 RepID=A2EJD7_TRIV3|nr:protein ubiquitination [Trichomonas vaginalis G3]EAY07194.1 hypothetical protein TVAG_050090 [Trichomonas vaginalis G3]KAI5533882.1 protein ubiquitination [Trichomonas vaginalis G3]|eukprot:XP_001319417.1 hypothetical protein [Trichomonas vaginalis G3]